jgi:hypothetical protein
VCKPYRLEEYLLPWYQMVASMKQEKGKIFCVKVTDDDAYDEQDDRYILDLAHEYEISRYHSAFVISYDKFRNFKKTKL